MSSNRTRGSAGSLVLAVATPAATCPTDDHTLEYDMDSHCSAWGRANLLPILRKQMVGIVIPDHSHVYRRSHHMYMLGCNPRYPVTFIVTGGVEPNPIRPYPAPGSQRADEHHYALEPNGVYDGTYRNPARSETEFPP